MEIRANSLANLSLTSEMWCGMTLLFSFLNHTVLLISLPSADVCALKNSLLDCNVNYLVVSDSIFNFFLTSI